MRRARQGFDKSWQPFSIGVLVATDLALGSAGRVLACLDRMEAQDAQIAATLADYRSIGMDRRG